MPLFPEQVRPSAFVASSGVNANLAEAIAHRLAHVIRAEVWNDHTFFAGRMTLATLHTLLRQHEFAVCVFGTRLGETQLTPNVLIELGMFLSANGAGRTFIVMHDGHATLDPPSNLAGLTYIRIPASASSVDGAAEYAYNKIYDAISKLWHSPQGIRAQGTAWHAAFMTKTALQQLKQQDVITYDIIDTVILDIEQCVTFRASFTMHNYDTPISGYYFGRGPKYGSMAYVQYDGRDHTRGIEFYGTLAVSIPAVADLWGTFMSRDEIAANMDAISVGGFRIRRVPKE